MSLQTLRAAPGETQAVSGIRPTHHDLSAGGTNRKRTVIYPVPLSIRIAHTLWLAFAIGTILMLAFA